MTPTEELEYLQQLVATSESIAALSDGNIPETLANLICDKIAHLCPGTS